MAVTLLTVISFALAAVARHPADGFLAMAVDVAGTGAALALANIFAVTAPYPAERRVGSPTLRPAEGYRGSAIGSSLGTLAGTAVAVIPVLVAVALTTGSRRRPGCRCSLCARVRTASACLGGRVHRGQDRRAAAA